MVYASVALAIQVLALVIWIARFYILEDRSAPMVGTDFAIFWSAARVAIEHGAASVFSPQWMQPIEAALWHQVHYAPWPYPPTFLLAVLPLGFLPFGYALILYSSLGLIAYGTMFARIARNIDRTLLPLLAAFPGVSVAVGLGQNSLITVGAAGAALALLETNSALAGVCIAVLVIKPQFGVLFPLALLCGRQWNAFIVSAVCTVVLAATSVAVLGLDAWSAFASFLPEFTRIAVEQGGVNQTWSGMSTVFAIGRSLGLSVHAAYLVQGLVALPAVMAMAFLWAKRARFELRASSLVIATLLAQPYFMFYDLAWLILPIVFLIRDGKISSLSRVEWAVLSAAWLAPAQGFLAAFGSHYLQIVPAVLIAMLVLVMRRYRVTSAVLPARSCAMQGERSVANAIDTPPR